MAESTTPVIKGKFLTLGNHKIHYLDEGKGKIILFVHGIPEWSMTYAPVVKALSSEFRCIVPDHLGFGYSDKDENAKLTPSDHSDRLIILIKELKLEKVHLVVHDMGGPIGIGALIQDPGRFSSLTISNSWLWNLNGTSAGNVLKLMNGWLGKWLYLNIGFSVKFMAKNGFYRSADFKRWKDTFWAVHTNKQERFANYQLMLEMLRSGAEYDRILDELKKIKLPVQLVWGAKDKFFTSKDYLSRFQKELPASTVILLNDTGHFPHIEAPELFSESIREFISKIY